METPLRKPINFKDKIPSSYKRKFLYLAFSPLMHNNTKSRNKSLKTKNEFNLSVSPRISIIKNSFLFYHNNKKLEKRSSTSVSLSKIKLFNHYDNKENIIYNKKFVQKGSYNILVAVRVRPLNEKEELISSEETINVENKNTIILKDPNGYINPNNIRAKEQFLNFDYAFDKYETQENIFNNTTKFLINGVVNGYNATVFAYGATGAGKTYTMLGNDENPGIMIYTLKELFNEIKLYNDREFKIKLWYLEIYNENIRDLLINNSENLELREDPIKGLIVNGITEKETNSSEDILSLLKKGNKNRTTEETDANETSSRSHAILQILVSYREKENNKENVNNINTININDINNNSNNIKFGKLNLIDLAGSERASISGRNGIRLIKGGNINRSLLVLGNCINALCESNIKGNNSKLIRLLKNSLGGNSRAVMIANVSPFIYNFDDTYNTLKYAERAKYIKTKINKNIINYNTQYLRNNYLNVIRKLHGKINDLENKLLFYETNDKLIKNIDFNTTPQLSVKKINEEIEDNNILDKKIISPKQNENNNNNENEKINNIDIIKENDIELETSNINSIIEENNKIESLFEDYIQQTQAEVKIKQKIMGILYDIYLLNNIINEKELKKKNISEEKTKLKSYKKILDKNMICYKDISQKNENILLKYTTTDNKNTEIETETKNNNKNIIDNDKIELNELQKKFLYTISKISKIQIENIEIKYNYALLKDEILNKNKKIKNLQKQIEFRDIIIKEKISLDNNNITDEEINKKHSILLSEQQRAKFKTCTRLKNKHLTETNNDNNDTTEKNKNINNNNDKNINLNIDIENSINVQKGKSKNRKKNYSFHPRNASFIKSDKIQTPNRERNFENSMVTHTSINNRINEKDNNNKQYDNTEFNLDDKKITCDMLSKEENNEIIGNEFNEIIKNFNLGNITSENFGDINITKKRTSSAILNNNNSKNKKAIKNNNVIKIKNKDKSKDKDNDKDDINDDDNGEDTNNKTLKSVLNEIKIMNSDINSKLNIIEKSSKNQSNSQIKPISRTMANIENINNYINNESLKDSNKKNKRQTSNKQNNNINSFKSKKSENIEKIINIKKNNLKTTCNSSSNLNLITANTYNFKDSDNSNNNISKQNSNLNKEFSGDNINGTNPCFIISVNRNKKNKKISLASSMSSNIQLNTINANKDIKNLKTKSPLCNTKSISIKEFATSSSKNVNYHKMAKNNSIQRNKSLLNNNIDKDELRKKIKETLKSKRNKYKIKKKYTKVDGKESPCDSNNNSYDRINNNEINNNINIDKIINSTIKNKE